MMMNTQASPPPSTATTQHDKQAKMMTPVLWYQSPKNFSSILPSNHVWWSSKVGSSADRPGIPKRGSQPTRSHSSASGALPLVSLLVLLAVVLLRTTPAVVGGGRSYCAGVPSSYVVRQWSIDMQQVPVVLLT